MSNDSSTTPAVHDNGPWRVLVLRANNDDPVWLIATVTLPTDVRPAEMRNGRYTDWQQVTEWVRAQVGQRASMTPISAVVWSIEEGGPR